LYCYICTNDDDSLFASGRSFAKNVRNKPLPATVSALQAQGTPTPRAFLFKTTRMDALKNPAFLLWSDKQKIGHIQLCSDQNYFGKEWINIGKFSSYYQAAEFAEKHCKIGSNKCNSSLLVKAYNDSRRDAADHNSDNNQHYDFYMIDDLHCKL
jgi:hypothetical protein